MNKKQRKQIIALVILCILWAISAHYNKITLPPPAVLKTKAEKVVQTESPLKARFRKLRSEMDALYHYRIKPAPFDDSANPFRLPGSKQAAEVVLPKELEAVPAGNADEVLRKAVAGIKVGGVVLMNGVMQLTIDGQLHKVGDVFTAKVVQKTDAGTKPDSPAKTVLMRLRSLSEYSATLALDDPAIGFAELKIRLK